MIQKYSKTHQSTCNNGCANLQISLPLHPGVIGLFLMEVIFMMAWTSKSRNVLGPSDSSCDLFIPWLEVTNNL